MGSWPNDLDDKDATPAMPTTVLLRSAPLALCELDPFRLLHKNLLVKRVRLLNFSRDHQPITST